MKIIIFYLSLLFLNGAFAQSSFFRTFEGKNANSVVQTSDSEYVFCGQILTGAPNYYDLLLVKTDSLGDTIFTKSYGGSHFDEGFSVKETYDGGYIIAGQYGEPDTLLEGHSSIYILKTDSKGDTLWTFVKNVGLGDQARSIVQTMDSSFVFAGYVNGTNSGYATAYMSKIDQSGKELWNRTFEGPSFASSIILTQDGGYAYTGRFGGIPFAGGFVVKTDSKGDTVWTRELPGGPGDGKEIIQDQDGNFLVTGIFFDRPNSAFLTKLSNSGDVLWTKLYGGTGNDRGYAVDQTQDGGYIIVGETASYSTGSFNDTDIWLIRMDAEGDTLWTQTYGRFTHDTGFSVKTCKDGGFIISGRHDDGHKVFLLKTDSLGIAPELTTNTKDIPAQAISFSKIYPNPALASGDRYLTLEFTSPIEGRVVFDVITSGGKIVEQKVLEKGIKKHNFFLSSHKEGIYFYKLKSLSSKLIETGRFIITD